MTVNASRDVIANMTTTVKMLVQKAVTSGELCQQFKSRGRAHNVSYLNNQTLQQNACYDPKAIVAPIVFPTPEPSKSKNPSPLVADENPAPSVSTSLSTTRSITLLGLILIVGFFRFSPGAAGLVSKKWKKNMKGVYGGGGGGGFTGCAHCYDILVVLSDTEEVLVENVRHEDIFFLSDTPHDQQLEPEASEISSSHSHGGVKDTVWMMNNTGHLLTAGLQVHFSDRYGCLSAGNAKGHKEDEGINIFTVNGEGRSRSSSRSGRLLDDGEISSGSTKRLKKGERADTVRRVVSSVGVRKHLHDDGKSEGGEASVYTESVAMPDVAMYRGIIIAARAADVQSKSEMFSLDHRTAHPRRVKHIAVESASFSGSDAGRHRKGRPCTVIPDMLRPTPISGFNRSSSHSLSLSISRSRCDSDPSARLVRLAHSKEVRREKEIGREKGKEKKGRKVLPYSGGSGEQGVECSRNNRVDAHKQSRRCVHKLRYSDSRGASGELVSIDIAALAFNRDIGRNPNRDSRDLPFVGPVVGHRRIKERGLGIERMSRSPTTLPSQCNSNSDVSHSSEGSGSDVSSDGKDVHANADDNNNDDDDEEGKHEHPSNAKKRQRELEQQRLRGELTREKRREKREKGKEGTASHPRNLPLHNFTTLSSLTNCFSDSDSESYSSHSSTLTSAPSSSSSESSRAPPVLTKTAPSPNNKFTSNSNFDSNSLREGERKLSSNEGHIKTTLSYCCSNIFLVNIFHRSCILLFLSFPFYYHLSHFPAKHNREAQSIRSEQLPKRMGWHCFTPNPHLCSSSSLSRVSSGSRSRSFSPSRSRSLSPVFSPSLFGPPGDPLKKLELEREFGINASQTCIYGTQEVEEEDDSCNEKDEKDKDGDNGSATQRRSNLNNNNNNNDKKSNNNKKKSKVKVKARTRFSIPSSKFNQAAAECALLHRNSHFNLLDAPEELAWDGEEKAT